MGTTLANKAYDHIRNKLLHKQLPPGARLGYRPIAKEIGISATPVREAMNKLVAEGLVEVLPELGAVVRILDRDESVEIYQMRFALESCAIGWAVGHLRRQDLSELRHLWDEIRECGLMLRESGQNLMSDEIERRFITSDIRFHTLILEAAGNQTLLKTVMDLHILSRAIACDQTRHDMTMIACAYRDHGRILRALERRDAAGARRAMRQHMRNAMRLALSAFRHNRGRMRHQI